MPHSLVYYNWLVDKDALKKRSTLNLVDVWKCYFKAKCVCNEQEMHLSSVGDSDGKCDIIAYIRSSYLGHLLKLD